eukprot:scaffold165528_cov18-Prasinocladus_malaysianus.AAC.1
MIKSHSVELSRQATNFVKYGHNANERQSKYGRRQKRGDEDSQGIPAALVVIITHTWLVGRTKLARGN